MFSAFKNKPDAKEIVKDDSTGGGKDVTQGVVDTEKILLPWKNRWKVNTEKFKTANLHNCAHSTCKNKKQHLFLL